MCKADTVGNELPEWVQRALDTGEPIDDPPGRRAAPRRGWAGLCAVVDPGNPGLERPLVWGLNVGPGGVGCISDWELIVGRNYDLVPLDEMGDPVRVRVIHCTRTAQGYRAGFAFVGEDA